MPCSPKARKQIWPEGVDAGPGKNIGAAKICQCAAVLASNTTGRNGGLFKSYGEDIMKTLVHISLSDLLKRTGG